MNSGPAMLLAEDITVGDHSTAQFLGLTFNIDTLLSTLVVSLIVIGLGLLLRWRVTSQGVPGKIQLLWETLTSWIEEQVESLMGIRVAPYTVPLSVALFLFILLGNWIELIPTQIPGHHALLPAPTADVNTTYSLALLVIVWVHIASLRRNRGGYFAHYFRPYPVLAPLNFLEEVARPVSLALRLFGNIFAGAVMVQIIGLLPFFVSWLPQAAWKLFALFVGVIQAVIFSLLTITYFSLQLGSSSEEH